MQISFKAAKVFYLPNQTNQLKNNVTRQSLDGLKTNVVRKPCTTKFKFGRVAGKQKGDGNHISGILIRGAKNRL